MINQYSNEELANGYLKVTSGPLSSSLTRLNQASIILHYPENLGEIYTDKKKWKGLKMNELKKLNTSLVEIILENGVDKAKIIVEEARQKSIDSINLFKDIPSQTTPNGINLAGRSRTYYK